jgi:hypothetical protein
MAKREYTLEEQLEYYKKKASGKGGSSRKSSGTRTRSGKSGKDAPKRSGCVLVEDYKDKDGNHTGQPMLWGWRLSKRFGFQKFTAYLSKDGGAPQNGTSTDVCLVFVVNLETEGIGKQTLTGVWSKKYKKLTITDAGLVANPSAPRGGYFGRGGERFKDKVK